MADVSREHSSKSKNNRSHNKEKHKERKHSSHHKDNDIENDSKHNFRTNHKKDVPYKDTKQKACDRNDRKHDERKIHYTQPQDDRYISYRSNERNHHSSAPSYRHDKHENIDDGSRNSLSNHDRYSNKYAGNTYNRSSYNEPRYDERRTNDERFVTFNRSTSTNSDECVASLWQKIDYLSNQVDVLTQENERLKYSLNMRYNAHDDPHSEVTIAFRNKDLEERFLPILTELASDLIQGHFTVDDIRDIKFSKNNSLNGKENLKDLPEGELFQLDNSTAEPDENPPVPKYETSFAEVLEDEDGKIKLNEKREKPRFPKVCFNCGEDHVISKCPHKINYYKVANAKKQQRGPPPTVRYHLNKEQGESGFKPGVLSNDLRDALGLKTDQIPSYIYRMRLINYPPGWLQEAMVESSGIAVYDSSGSVLRNESDGNAEPIINRSEIRYDPDKFIDFPGFNVPLPPDCVDESYELGFPPMQEHQMRSYVEQNMPKVEIRPNRKRKLNLTIETSTMVQRFEEDMDLDEDLGETFFQFTPPLPQDAPPPPPPEEAPEPPPEDAPEPPPDDAPEPPPDDAPKLAPENASEPSSEETRRIVASHDSDSGTNTPMSDSIMETLAPVVKRFKMEYSDSADAHSSSPSLKELEEIKKRLVMELGIVSECPSPNVQDDSQANASDAEELNPNSDSRGSFPCQESCNDLSNFSDSSFGSSPAEIGQSARTLQKSESVCSKSKQMTLGTPSLSRHSSYQKLPEYEKFAQNVTSHINFENLPNSTGTYERMKKVLKKVKEKFNALMP